MDMSLKMSLFKLLCPEMEKQTPHNTYYGTNILNCLQVLAYLIITDKPTVLAQLFIILLMRRVRPISMKYLWKTHNFPMGAK